MERSLKLDYFQNTIEVFYLKQILFKEPNETSI